jgi:hypothetical protein
MCLQQSERYAVLERPATHTNSKTLTQPLCTFACRDFDSTVPHRFVLMGIPLVIWYDPTYNSSSSSSDSSQGWRVFTDACPHRLVPLSEGRVTPTGRLECPYVSGVLQQCLYHSLAGQACLAEPFG